MYQISRDHAFNYQPHAKDQAGDQPEIMRVEARPKAAIKNFSVIDLAGVDPNCVEDSKENHGGVERGFFTSESHDDVEILE